MIEIGTSVVVTTADGREQTGRVLYQRMKPPEYREPAAFSVYLDQRADDPAYAGSIFRASQVRDRCTFESPGTGCRCCRPAEHLGHHLYRCTSPDCPGRPWASSSIHEECQTGRAA